MLYKDLQNVCSLILNTFVNYLTLFAFLLLLIYFSYNLIGETRKLILMFLAVTFNNRSLHEYVSL